jgi:hypothetical protein
MYPMVLTAHSLVRWVVIVLGAWAVAHAFAGLRSGRQWTDADRRPAMFFMIAIDIQLLLGLALYVALSPLTREAMLNMAAAMRAAPLRFFAVEHPALMLLAVVFAHLGPSRGGSASSRARQRRALTWCGLALFVILLATPWPFMPQGRPWVRW